VENPAGGRRGALAAKKKATVLSSGDSFTGGLAPAPEQRRDTMTLSREATPIPGSEQAPPDLMRAMMQEMLQAALQEEFDRFLGAGRWQRSEERRGWRNGYKRRHLHTRVGTIELRIPKDREGRFQPSLFERYQRSEKALVLALVEMYIQGVSTRKVQKVVEQLCGLLVSASQVSVLVKSLDAELEAWRTRSLAGLRYPYLIVDAHYEKVRREGRVISTAVLGVIGIREDGYRERLGVWSGPSESRESWVRVFRDLVQRGVEGVEYVVSDEHAGLVQALGLYFPEAAHQRCQVHYLRNALSYVTTDALRNEVLTGLRDAWAAPTREEAESRVTKLLDGIRAKAPKLTEWMEESVHETLSCFVLPAGIHRTRLRSTNSIEHDHAEIRRRTRVVRIFPNEASLVRLASALAIERNEQWMERRYLTMPQASPADAASQATLLRQSA
jgi:putative transposase